MGTNSKPVLGAVTAILGTAIIAVHFAVHEFMMYKGGDKGFHLPTFVLGGLMAMYGAFLMYPDKITAWMTLMKDLLMFWKGKDA